MSAFTDAEIIELAKVVSNDMDRASKTLQAFTQSVTTGVYANWTAYAAKETDQQRLLATGLEFAGRCRALVDNNKVALAAALDIIAGGMLDAEGNTLTRQQLLDELAAVGQ